MKKRPILPIEKRKRRRKRKIIQHIPKE